MSKDGKQASEASAIPVEIFYHIFENLPKASLTNAARTNTTFHELSEKLIYRRLELKSMSQAVQCCQTLLRKPSLADTVRSVVVMIDTVRNPQATPAFANLLSAALRLMTNITSLHLALEGPFACVLEGCYFPRLETFSSIVELTPDFTPMASFLGRHRRITHLCLGGEVAGQAFALPPGSLPVLQTYMGSRRLVPFVVPHRPISRVTLAWHAANVELEVDCVIPFLGQAATPLRHFNCATLGWSSVLIRTVAAYLPKLYSMRLHNISSDYHNEAVNNPLFEHLDKG